MQMNPYLCFDGRCEAALTFYARCLGGELGAIFRYTGSPFADRVPPEWGDKVMHGSVTFRGQMLAGADVAPGAYEAPKGVSLSLQLKDTAEAERIFRELSEDGKVGTPLAKTFWAERFGTVVDRFGVPWMVNCE